MSGLSKVVKSLRAGDNTVLMLDSKLPESVWTKFKIDGKEHTPVPIYDLPNCVATKEKGSFEGKEIIFI